jgi:hypothetical protein
VRSHSNLSNSLRKSSATVRRCGERALLDSRRVIAERELASVARMLRRLRSLADRFDAKRWQLVHRTFEIQRMSIELDVRNGLITRRQADREINALAGSRP